MQIPNRYVQCAFALSLLATGFVALSISTPAVAEPCPNETCLAGYQCGGQYSTVYPPGVMSLCSASMDGQACNWCDGTTVVRVCVSLSQTRKCTRPATKTKCGNPKKGKCEKTWSIAIGDVWWCRDTGAAGTHKCDVTEQCSGDAACEGS
jgi:hypothetical protein